MYQKPGSSTARKKSYQTSLIRCLDFLDRDRVRRRAARVLGRHHRQLEGKLVDLKSCWQLTEVRLFQGIHETEYTRKNGVTNIKLTGDKVMAARLSDRIDFLRLKTYTKGRQIDWGFTSAYRRTHILTGSAGSLSMFQQPNGPARVHHASEEELRGIQVFHQQGHQNRNRHDRQHGPHGVVVVKESHQLQFTLHGHLVSWPVRAAESQLDVTSTDDYRKMREYEQETFLSMVKQVKNAGATLAI
ncbi:uncharacterized protein LOC6042162 [Culex quinquefasciatus]|uniref:uncharacterized protein LOC6042162 n=1 Tax=Culex quinquefasciatus TaxID=7176 RepID=UPI0018E2A1E1|nr:uncharacterized protein LOC6042162 [Culex quinquefasciatus]